MLNFILARIRRLVARGRPCQPITPAPPERGAVGLPSPRAPEPRGPSAGLLVLMGTLAMLATGCASLLPKAAATVEGRWASYEDARDAVERIKPYHTTRAELHAAGFDPYNTPGVTILTYSDLIQRFAVGSVVRPDELDRGIRECLQSGKACSAYQLRQELRKRDRVGNFWLDSLQFHRITDVTGWSFNALIVLVGDQVVYTLYGGQPRIREKETTRNPLGPFQGWGDQAGRILIQ